MTFGSTINHSTCLRGLIIENLKNRPVIILEIYLKIANRYYVEIANYEYDDPLILKPLEATQIKLPNVSFYSIGMKIVEIENLLNNRKVSKKIVLVTTKGLIEEKGKIRIKDHPISQMLQKKAAVIMPRTNPDDMRMCKETISDLPVYNCFRLTILRFACYLYEKYR